MSQQYEMGVQIKDFNPKLRNAIEVAAAEEWEFEDGDWFLAQDGVLSCSGQNQLCGGETPDEFARRLTLAIYRANKARCEVEVSATCLECLPCDTFNLDCNISDEDIRGEQKKFRVAYRDGDNKGEVEVEARDEEDARDVFSETTPADEIIDVTEVEE